jgi:uncharacterized membrane protein YhfC
MNIRLICAIIAMAVTVGGLIGFIVYLVKKRRIHLRMIDIMLGILACFLARQILFSLAANLISKIPGITGLAQSNVYFTPFLSALLSTLLTIAVFWLLIRMFYGNGFTQQNACGIATGAAVIEVLYNLLTPLLSNVSYFVMEANGTLESSLGKYYDAATVQSIIQTYKGYTSNYYLYFGTVALLVIANHYLIQTMFRDAVATRQRFTLTMMLLIQMAYSLFYYFASPISMPIVTIFALVFAFGLFWFADKHNKELDEAYPSSIGKDY